MKFPLFVDLNGKKILIVGAGAVAARRAAVLVEFGAKVIVVAPEDGSMGAVQNVEIEDERTEKHVQPDKCASDENMSWEYQTVPVRELAKAGRLIWKQHAFGEQDFKDLEQAALVLAATNDPAVNDYIVQLCHERCIPVNHAGDQNQCDFQFPAIVQKDPVVIGINAGGKDHGLVRRVAAALREWIAGEAF